MDYRAHASVLCLVVLTLVTPATAQESDDEQIQEVIVTGSYIKRSNYDSPAPVTSIGQLDIEAASTPNMADILFNQTNNFGTEVMSNPFADGAGSASNATSFAGSQQGGIGRANLRGLGNRTTMTLMDGHRVLFSDANFLYPMIAVDRIDILADSSSALYGSDAIAGAVNFIPLTNYEGLKIEVSRRDAMDISAPDDSFSILAGGSYGNGSGLIAITHRSRDRAIQSDFPKYVQKSAASNSRNLVARGFPGGFHVTARDPVGDSLGLITNRANEFSDPGCEHDFMNDGEDATSPYHRRWGINEGWRCRSDVTSILDYQAELEMTHAYARIEHNLNENVTVSLDAMAGRQEFDNRWLPAPLNANDRVNVHGDIAGNPFVAFIDQNGNGLIDANERIRAQDNCNYVDCTSGDGFADRDINGDGIADPSAQAIFGAPQLLLSLTDDSDGDGIPDRFDDDAGGVTFSEDVRIANWSPFGKNIQGLPAILENDGNSRRGTKVDNFRLSGAIDAEIPNSTWGINAAFIWERRQSEHPQATISPVNMSTPQVAESLLCVGPDLQSGACTQFNPFSTSQFQVVDRVPTNTITPESDPAFNTPAEIDKLLVPNSDLLIEGATMFDIVAVGSLFDAWAGPLQMAVGLHFRDQTLKVAPSQLNASQTNFFGAAIQAVDTRIEALDYFVELNLPLLSDSKLGNAELQLAARTTTNDVEATQGLIAKDSFDETVMKAAVLWQPTDWLSVRGSYGEGFVVPLMTQLFAPAGTATRQIVDPTCGAIWDELGVQIDAAYCDYDPATGAPFDEQGVAVNTGGNPALEPETSETVNIGVTFLLLDRDLSISLDWLEADLEGRVFVFNNVTLPAYEQLRFAETLQGSSCADPACAEQLRADWIANGETAIVREGGDGRITDIFGVPTNLLGSSVSTLDFRAAYRFDSPFNDNGQFQARLQGTYMDSFEFQVNPLSPVVEGAGKRNSPGLGSGLQLAALPKYRANLSLDYALDNHYTRLTARYHDGVEDLTATGGIRPQNSRGEVPAETYWDLFYTYTAEGLVGDGTTIFTVGVTNLFDTLPYALEDTGGIEQMLDNPFGRMLTVRMSHEF
jgi:iron complex outermembrane receptor protein